MFKNIMLTIITIASTTAIVGCKQDTLVGKPINVAGDTIASVNGVAIVDSEITAALKARNLEDQPATRKAILEEAINLELIRQSAVAEKLHEDPAIAAEVNRQTTNALASIYMRNIVQTQAITEEDLLAEYNAGVANMAKHEYKSRHILSTTKEDALANIDKLDKGAKFAELAKEKSIGPSAPNGGDLGWANPGAFVPAFSNALQALEPGKYSKEPIETQFGWHVILLEDKRETNVPSLDSMRQQLQRAVFNKRAQNHISSLRDKAKIDIPEEAAATEEEAPKT